MEPQPPSPGSCGAPEDDTDGAECGIEIEAGSCASGNRDGDRDSPGTQRVQSINVFTLMMSARRDGCDSAGEPLAMATICRERAQKRVTPSPAQKDTTMMSDEDEDTESQLKRARTAGAGASPTHSPPCFSHVHLHPPTHRQHASHRRQDERERAPQKDTPTASR